MNMLNPAELRALVHHDRVHRSIYTDPAIYALEMQNIFGRAWVYVGHDSLVPNPGDYLAARIGAEPVLLSRHTDGKVYVLHNRCSHRGATVCNDERGSVKLFRCPYHGWTFATNGDLDAVSMRRGYGPDFNLDDPALGMGRVARMENYRGFVFASLSPTGPDLQTFLGQARESLDEIVDRAPDGELNLRGGVHKYVFRGNWKLQLENVIDMYHVPFSHESTISRSGRQFGRRPGEGEASAISDRGAAADRWEQRVAWGAAQYGHSYAGHQPVAEGLPDDPLFREYIAALEARHGKARTEEILKPRRHNSAFFPNMTLQALNYHVRVIIPLAVDRTEIHVYPVQFKGAPEAMNAGFVRHMNVTHSAASFIQTDDLECFRRCQEGIATQSSDWLWFARGIATDRPDEHGDILNKGTVETQQRAQHAAWLHFMSETA